MFKSQMKFQKILFLALLILGALTFVYAISFGTAFYPLYLSQAYGTVEGAEFFDEVQGYNNQLLVMSIITILASLIPFVLNTHKRRKYYIGNYIGAGIQGAAYLGASIFTIVNTVSYQTLFYSEVNLEQLVAQCEKRGWIYTNPAIFFNLGYVISALLLVSVGLIVFDLLWKNKLVKEESNMLKGAE